MPNKITSDTRLHRIVNLGLVLTDILVCIRMWFVLDCEVICSSSVLHDPGKPLISSTVVTHHLFASTTMLTSSTMLTSTTSVSPTSSPVTLADQVIVVLSIEIVSKILLCYR